MPSPLDLQTSVYVAGGALHASAARQSWNLGYLPALSSFLLGLICVACGAVGSGSPSLPASITVQPNSAQPFTGGNVQFTALVQNTASRAVSWQVNQIPGGNATVGMISSTGYYVAPNSVPNPPTVTVTAVSQGDPTLTGSAEVTIQSLATIQGPLILSPALASVTTSSPAGAQMLQLQVLTTGVTNTDVNWAVDGMANGSAAVGTISTSGVYTPPAAAGPHLVKATLIANPNAIGTATVEVTDFPGTLTWRNDNSRSGWNKKELALAPATVNSSTFGKLFSCTVDGYIYAQPLYVPNLAIPGKGIHNVVFVATEKDLVYAFDADANPCQPLWSTPAKLFQSGEEPVSNSNMTVVPFAGITGTPVIGGPTVASYLYVIAATQTVAPNPTYSHWLYAVDLATGGIQPARVPIVSPDLQFDSSLENQRPALLLDSGTLYIAFGSNGLPGNFNYHGWLFAYDSATLQQTGVFDVTPAAVQGGIWQSGGGPSADSNHNVFVVTGDGPFDVNQGGASYGDTFVRLAMSGGLSVSDYFTPCNQAALQAAELDVGATAPVILPDSPTRPPLLIGGSKGGSLYIVNRASMGGYVPFPCPPTSPPPFQTIPLPTGANSNSLPILGTPLFWNNAVYVAPGNGNLMSFSMSAEGVLDSSPASKSMETLGPQGATPVISSNGTNNAILWLIDTSGALATPNKPAILRAYDPADLSHEVYDSGMAPNNRDAAGLAVKFTVPTVANGKVYVGTQTELVVYGFLH